MSGLTRRGFLRLGALAGAGILIEVLPGGGLLVGVALGDEGALPDPAGWRPNAWLLLDRTGCTITVARSEMGQGVRTALPRMVAEELDLDPSQIRVVHPIARPELNMRTSGSGSTFGAWHPLRQAGAGARALLLNVARLHLKVAEESLRTESGFVVHDASGRRVAYAELIELAKASVLFGEPPLKDPSAFRLVGHSASRIDGPDIVRGRARYGLDTRRPGLLYAAIARPPRFGDRLTGFDDRAARQVPGVTGTYEISNAVAVVARDTWSAIRGRDALATRWTQGPGGDFDSRAHNDQLRAAAQRPGRPAHTDPGVDAAFAGAARRFESVFEYPFQIHAPMEPMNAIAQVDATGASVLVPTQAANQVHTAVAEKLGLAPEKVRIELTLLGGGFGRRLGTDYAVEAAEVARAARAPVQVVWTREDDMAQGFFHPAAVVRIEAGVDGRGLPVAWRHTLAISFLNYRGGPDDPNDPELPGDYVWGAHDQPYALGALAAGANFVEAPVPCGPWRAVHYPAQVLAREATLDELARAGGHDPLAYRLELLGTDGAPEAIARERTRLARVLELAAEKAGWGRKLGAGRGLGIAGNLYHGRTTVAQVAEVSVDDAGRVRVHRVVCAVDCGRVVNPLGAAGQVESAVVWGLSAALASEASFKHGRVEQSNFSDYPVLRMSDTPEIEAHFVESDAHPSGVGEQPVAPVAAAVANAIFAATGRMPRRCPFRMNDLRD